MSKDDSNNTQISSASIFCHKGSLYVMWCIVCMRVIKRELGFLANPRSSGLLSLDSRSDGQLNNF
ncbi:hypothetical protein CHUAL_007791 [Chamberlinius hualienensis]